MKSLDLDKLIKACQNKLSDAWERYEGAEYDELDDYGDAYDNAWAEFKAAIEAYVNERVVVARIDELNWLKTMSDHRLYKEGTYYEINGKHVEYRINQLTKDSGGATNE